MRYWINELWRLGYMLFGLGALGLLIGQLDGRVLSGLGWGISAGLALYVFLHLRHVRMLYVWLLKNPRTPPPVGTGVWGDLFTRLYTYQKAQNLHKSRYRDILRRIQESAEAMQDGVIMVNAKANLEWWNNAATNMLRLKPDQDHGQPIINLLRDPRFATYVLNKAYQEPLVIPSPIHANRTIQITITLFGDNERLLIIRDITRLHQLEQMRRDFVANVSHELRTPLTVLAGYLETYSEHASDLPERWQRGFDQMQAQTKRMDNLVKDLLKLSSLETEQATGDDERISVQSLLEEVMQDGESLSNGKQTFVLNINEESELLGNSRDIDSAISNLVYNAVRYSPEGSVITLSWDKNAKGAVLSVSDNGEGFDPIHIPRLTERFYRVDKGRSAETGGTGLGLAIVKHVLIRHQAHLEIISSPGHGATFSCVFPEKRLAQPRTAKA